MCSTALQTENSINLCGATFTRQNLILAAADKTWLSCLYWLNIREDPVGGGRRGSEGRVDPSLQVLFLMVKEAVLVDVKRTIIISGRGDNLVNKRGEEGDARRGREGGRGGVEGLTGKPRRAHSSFSSSLENSSWDRCVF